MIHDDTSGGGDAGDAELEKDPPAKTVKIKKAAGAAEERGDDESGAVEIYHTCLLTRRMELSIDQCNPSYIMNAIVGNLKHELDGTCITEGYVKPNSIEDIAYSSGILKKGVIEFDLHFKCEICLPVRGAVYSVSFKSMTKAGIHAELNDQEGNRPVTFFLNRELHVDNEHFAKYEDTDFQKANRCFKAKLLFLRFELNDSFISAIGELVA